MVDASSLGSTGLKYWPSFDDLSRDLRSDIPALARYMLLAPTYWSFVD